MSHLHFRQNVAPVSALEAQIRAEAALRIVLFCALLHLRRPQLPLHSQSGTEACQGIGSCETASG